MEDFKLSDVVHLLEAMEEASSLPGTKPAGCRCCDRIGLPILPVRYGVSDRHTSDWRQDLPWSMAVHANRQFPAPREVRYVLRLMREGYLYLFDERRARWQAWAITHDSRFEEFDPIKRDAGAITSGETYTNPPCNVPENNLTARLISLPKAQEASTVHVGYSDHPLTDAMLGRLERNEGGLRDRLFSPFDVAAWLNTGDSAGAIPSVELGKYVMEYSDYYPREGQEDDGFPFLGLDDRLPSATQRLRERMNWMVQDTPQWIDKTPIVAVPDPIGICMSVNHFRNQAKLCLDSYARRKDVVEKKVTSELIEGIREAVQSKAEHQADRYIERVRRAEVFGDQRLAEEFDALTDHTEQARRWALMGDIDRGRIERGRRELEILRGQQDSRAPEYRRRAIEQSWEKYLECYNEQQRLDFESHYRAHLERDTHAVVRLAEIHRDWLASDDVRHALQGYDEGDLDNGAAYEVAVAAMTVGMSMTEVGQEAVDDLIERSLDDIDSYLWRATFANYRPAMDMVKEMVFEAAFWGSKVVGPLKRVLGADMDQRSQTENLLATMADAMARKLGFVSSADIANNTLARMWQAVGWTRYGIKTSLMFFDAKPSQLVSMYDQVLWRNELAIRNIQHDLIHFFPPLDDIAHEQPIRLWSFVPTSIDPLQRPIIQAELAQSLEMRKIAVAATLTPNTWFGIFGASLEVINSVRLGEAVFDDNAAESQAERNSFFAGGLLYLASSIVGVANQMIHPVAVPESRLYKGLAWGGGIAGALGAWIFSVWNAVKAYRAFQDDNKIMAALYLSSSLIFIASGASALAAVAQQVGRISATEAAFGSLIISRSGWALVAARLGWIGLAVSLLIVVFEKDSLEKWLLRCVFGNGDVNARYRDVQAALDALDDMTR
ncbi:hypothetical protein KUW18_18240 [Halomonas sp. DP5Y7-2]|uniref:T6SS effector BTH_I2691 family protein n=1 Tax=Halomonas sp. DP5Y7-2 TaxID=2859076 RepID=UPI001C99D56C|nr:T6SS effector BTH_I2691 family protein [Halomonas sp. DP5Y7-2]MBY5986028.1 hypothetical protein [Halomonas sp. DP5Y7-2]